MSESLERPDTTSSLIFCTKCALAALLAYEAHFALGLHGAPWAPVSAVLVTHPSLHPSLRAAMIRVLTNLIGAGIGVLLALFIPQHALALALGVFFTGLACYFTRLDEGLRSGCVAVLIILMNREGDIWTHSLDRLISVWVGCVCAVLFTIFFDTLFSKILRRVKKPLSAPGHHE